MPEHRTCSDEQRVCPYCDHAYRVEAEDYSEDSRVETCGECGKNYHACDTFSVTHTAEMDCALNGDEHEPSAKYSQLCAKCGQYIAPQGDKA